MAEKQSLIGMFETKGYASLNAVCSFVASFVFGPLTELHRCIYLTEQCVDDDPQDIAELIRKCLSGKEKRRRMSTVFLCRFFLVFVPSARYTLSKRNA